MACIWGLQSLLTLQVYICVLKSNWVSTLCFLNWDLSLVEILATQGHENHHLFLMNPSQFNEKCPLHFVPPPPFPPSFPPCLPPFSLELPGLIWVEWYVTSLPFTWYFITIFVKAEWCPLRQWYISCAWSAGKCLLLKSRMSEHSSILPPS